MQPQWPQVIILPKAKSRFTRRRFRVPWFLLLPILLLVFSIWFISMVALQSPQDAAIGIALILLALPVYFLVKSSRKSLPGNVAANTDD